MKNPKYQHGSSEAGWMEQNETPRTDAVPKRYMTVVYEIVDETEWRKTNPLKYAHNGLSAVTVSAYDAIELLDEAEAEVERLDQMVEWFIENAPHFTLAQFNKHQRTLNSTDK